MIDILKLELLFLVIFQLIFIFREQMSSCLRRWRETAEEDEPVFPLSELPFEVQKIIVDNVLPADRLALRQASKHCRILVNDCGGLIPKVVDHFLVNPINKVFRFICKPMQLNLCDYRIAGNLSRILVRLAFLYTWT